MVLFSSGLNGVRVLPGDSGCPVGVNRQTPEHPVGLTMRSVDAGYLPSKCAGRIGRLTRLPPQFGQIDCSVWRAQSAQNVHSNVQMNAALESGGRFLPQHSQRGLISSI